MRDPPDTGPVAAGHGVEVDAPFVGRFGVGAARVPRMELDRRHLDGPDHGGEFGDAQFVGGAPVPREPQLHGVQPVRGSGGDAFLVDLRAAETVRAADALGKRCSMQGRSRRARTMPSPTDRVVGQVEFGFAAFGEVRAVRARQPDGPFADDEPDGIACLRSHLLNCSGRWGWRRVGGTSCLNRSRKPFDKAAQANPKVASTPPDR